MKKRVKCAAVMTALAIGSACLTACGPKSDNTEAGEKTTLRVEIFDRGDVPAGAGTITDNALIRWIQEEFGDPNNIQMEFVSVPRDQEIQQLNVLMSAGEAPDIVFSYSYNTLYDFYKRGGLADLTEYVQNSSNLKNILGDDILKRGQVDGKQVMIPGRRILTGRMAQLIRQDWLDKVGMKAPETKDEFYEVLKAFKEKDPGNVGEKNIPWAISASTPYFTDLLYSFAEWDEMSEAERAVTPWPMKPGFKEGLRFMNKLYNEGLISPDFALDKDSKQMQADFANGYVGFINDDFGRPLQSGSYYETLKKTVPDAKLTAVDTFNDKDGKHPKEIYTPVGLYIVVPASSDNAEAAVKYLDWMAQEDVLLTMQFGWENKTYKLDENGFPVVLETDEAKKLHWYNLGFDIAVIVNGKYLGSQERSVEFNAVATGENKDLYIDCYKNSIRDGWEPVTLPPNDALIKYETNISTKFTELVTKSIMAPSAEFDSLYDKLQKEFVEVGGKEVNEAAVKQYDEIMK
ncbi:MAG: extracellular solute-binding protein [Clostridia bacterium]|nr:extracellular solute-binding protein [Clostridia bacterium]